MADDDKDRPPSLRVVSDNPNAHTDRQIGSARRQAQRALSQFAATLLRTMAGSETEATYLILRLTHFIEAQKKLNALSGDWLTTSELQEALRQPDTELDASGDDYSHRRWLREHGMEVIVQGALRLAAHKILGERPHFGGKHSEAVIKDGIVLLEELKRPPPKPLVQSKRKAKTKKSGDIDLGPPDPRPRGRRKPWSSRDSRSYRDLKADKD
jgi:hypothetical protein